MFKVVLNDGSVRIGVWKALRFQLATVCVEEYEIKLISDYFKGVTTSIRGRERERDYFKGITIPNIRNPI